MKTNAWRTTKQQKNNEILWTSTIKKTICTCVYAKKVKTPEIGCFSCGNSMLTYLFVYFFECKRAIRRKSVAKIHFATTFWYLCCSIVAYSTVCLNSCTLYTPDMEWKQCSSASIPLGSLLCVWMQIEMKTNT